MPAKVRVRPHCDGPQQLADCTGREFTPFDAKSVLLFSRNIGLDNRRLVFRPKRQHDGELDAAEQARLEIRFDQRTADAQIGQPSIPH